MVALGIAVHGKPGAVDNRGDRSHEIAELEEVGEGLLRWDTHGADVIEVPRDIHLHTCAELTDPPVYFDDVELGVEHHHWTVLLYGEAATVGDFLVGYGYGK